MAVGNGRENLLHNDGSVTFAIVWPVYNLVEKFSACAKSDIQIYTAPDLLGYDEVALRILVNLKETNDVWVVLEAIERK